MRILLDYLPGSGGEEVAAVIANTLGSGYRIDTPAAVAAFAAMPEPDRLAAKFIHGRFASRVISLAHRKITSILLVSHPVERIKRMHAKYATDKKAFLHPLCKAMSAEKVASKSSEMQNELARSLNPDLFDIFVTSPAAILRLIGIQGVVELQQFDPDSPDLEQLNQQDMQLWEWIASNAPNGYWYRKRTWHPSEVAIVTTHYNPIGFKRLRETYYEWLPTVGHPVICYEMVLDGQEPEIEGSVVIRGTAENQLWQKERLINMSVKNLPTHVRFVAWIDHDIVFNRQSWLSDSVDMLQGGHDTVQLFSEIIWEGADREVLASTAGAVYQPNNGASNPGAAWIARRSWIDGIGGLHDKCIVGGGDSVWFAGLTGKRRQFESRHSAAFLDHIYRWYSRLPKSRVGYLPGAVRHLWHGTRENRQYTDRDEILGRMGFDPATHIEIDSSGLLKWSEEAPPEMREAVMSCFAHRREDG